MIGSSQSARQAAFKAAIEAFIQGRLAEKLKGQDEEKSQELREKYAYGAWLKDAAHRAPQIQAVTHVLKATHSSARGSSLYCPPSELPAHAAEVGTQALGQDFALDVVGNAAVLDVYKFLRVEVDGQSLLDALAQNDSDLLAALDADAATAQSLAEAFKSLTNASNNLTSHSLAKQVYWNVLDKAEDNGSYHLLQPLFPSSLMHAVHADVQDARFGEANKNARAARRDNKTHDAPFVQYRNVAVRKLGGTKPQNISQLNSERGGINYLLSSAPPQWKTQEAKTFRDADAVFARFYYFENVREQLATLIKFLKANPNPVMETRIKRERMEKAIGRQFAAFGAQQQEHSNAGWTYTDAGELPLYMQLWLDPERAELKLENDEAFGEALEWGDWPDQVATRFAQWLNARLDEKGLAVGDAEHKHWARQAIVDAAWPVPMQRRATPAGKEPRYE